jgi:hypothetical protein
MHKSEKYLKRHLRSFFPQKEDESDEKYQVCHRKISRGEFDIPRVSFNLNRPLLFPEKKPPQSRLLCHQFIPSMTFTRIRKLPHKSERLIRLCSCAKEVSDVSRNNVLSSYVVLWLPVSML